MMEKSATVLLLIFCQLAAFAQEQPEQEIKINCGSSTSTVTNGITWETDEPFIKTGTNHPIPANKNKVLTYLNTLRAFTEQNKNCYTLPAIAMSRYIITAMFFYANYDSLSAPPTFDLQIDGNKIVTVVSSSDKIQYYEIIYRCQKANMSVCLARTHDGQFPFISSLEAWRIPSTMYTGMSQDLAWINTYRYNYGTDNWITGSPFDDYNRIWEPKSAPDTLNISADSTAVTDTTGEFPPQSAIHSMIESPDETTSIFLSFNPVQTITTLYIEAYFTEPYLESSGMRWLDMYINDSSVSTVKPQFFTCNSVKALASLSNSNLTVELRPTGNTTLPPVISAIEIYASSDPLITTATHQDDLSGLAVLTTHFDQLKGWSGEPCLPANTAWQWLVCTGSNTPRVTTLNLSRYSLNGSLPDFSQMQALEDIDLSSNTLSGEIPGFLGQLPNIKKLNLSYNKFTGTLPSSIRNRRGLTYDITGTPGLDASGKDKSSKAMIIGLAVGIPLAIIILILALVFWLVWKPKQTQNQAPGPEMGNGTTQESLISNASTVQPNTPPLPTAPMEPTSEDHEDSLPVSTVNTTQDQQSMVPDMDLDELEEIIDENAKAGIPQNYLVVLPSDEEDDVTGGVYEAIASNDQSMVPDMELEELAEIIRHAKERTNDVVENKADS